MTFFFNVELHELFAYFRDGDCSHEIKRCLLLGRKVMTNLDSIFKSRDITLPTKVRVAQENGKPFEIVPQTMTQPPWPRKGSMNYIDISR